MRALLLAAVAAVALSGCETVSDTISDQTGTTLAERCERYQTELDLLRAIVTVAAPGSAKALAAIEAIERLELLVAVRCAGVAPAASGVDSAESP